MPTSMRGNVRRRAPTGREYRPVTSERKTAKKGSFEIREAEKLAHELMFSDEIKRDSERYIRAVEGRNVFEASDEHQYQWLTSQLSDATKLSRKQHYGLIAKAYATVASMEDYPSRKEAVLNFLEGKGRKPSARTSSIRLVVELFIYYGDEKDDKDRERASKLYSRDVAAIRHLSEQGIVPTNVIAHSEVPGEGLDQWSRKYWSSIKDKKKVKSSSGKALVGARSITNDNLLEIDGEPKEGRRNVVIWAQVDDEGGLCTNKMINLSGDQFVHLHNVFEILKRFEILDEVDLI